MKKMKQSFTFILVILVFASCKKDKAEINDGFTYYEVGFKFSRTDWRDTAFIVRTKDTQLIKQIDLQLALPVAERKLVVGGLVAGSGGYNKNASHEFKWHLKEDGWNLSDATIEIFDGAPYSEVDLNIDYWLDTIKAYGPWSSYIRKKLPGKPLN